LNFGNEFGGKMENLPRDSGFALAQFPVWEMQQLVSKKALSDFNQKAIADDLVNRISLNLLTGKQSTHDFSKWVQQQYQQGVETYFDQLRSYCFHYALKLVQSPETAEDISQDCISELLCSRAEINNIKAWLCRVAHNKAVSQISKESKDNKLSKELLIRAAVPPLNPDSDELPSQLSPEKIKKLLSRTDYQMFMELQKFKTLKEYAAHKQLSYQTAKEHKHRIKINLRSAYLREQGWQDSQEILSFQQLTAIKRFLNKLVTCFGSSELNEKTKNNLFTSPQMVWEAFKETSGIMQWDITALPERVFRLTVTAQTEAEPAIILIKIKLNRANRIGIVSCKRGLIVATIPSADGKMLTKVKGKSELNYQELLRLAPQATIYEPEYFADALIKLKPKK